MDLRALEDHAHMVCMLQDGAVQRGVLSMWTVYDHPNDYPHGFIARRFEIDKGNSRALDTALIGELQDIRKILTEAGLAKITRAPEDEPQIVEVWL